MDIKRIAIGTIVGGVTLYVVGYLIFELAFASYYAANITAARSENIGWAIAAGNLAFALLVTLGIETRAAPPTIANGFVTGAVIGCLAWLGAHLSYYATANVITYKLIIVDPLNELVHTGIAGAAIAAVLARVPGKTTRLASA
jgi:hypothetical protein